MQERAWGRGHATPPLVGIGYRQDLWPWIDSHPHEIDCLEITAEHFFGPNTRVRLHSLANAYPLIIHGLGLSLGSPGPLDEHLLDLFAGVVKDANPLWISDHLSFTRTSEIEFGHFNPICPNRENVGLIADHVREVVETCGKPLLLENITTSLRVVATTTSTLIVGYTISIPTGSRNCMSSVTSIAMHAGTTLIEKEYKAIFGS
jgi:uncharacterized protein (UPF0276 family)